MSKRVTVIAFGLLLIAGAASANVGPFSSWTTTVSTDVSQTMLIYDVVLETSGTPGTATSDTVYVVIGASRTTATTGFPPTTSMYGTLFRDGDGLNTFSGSFTFTGLDHTEDYKWGASAYYGGATTISTFTQFTSALFSFYSNTAQSFFSSYINTASTIFNVSPNNGQINFAINLGRSNTAAPNVLEIPTLGEWGLAALGLMLLGFGLVTLRRVRA